MPTFHPYSSLNSYIAPYSSDTHGGELVTEFNQRAALTVIGETTVDISTLDFPSSDGSGNFDFSGVSGLTRGTFTTSLSGCKSYDDFTVNTSGATLTIGPGEALIRGYYVASLEEITLQLSDVISASEAGNATVGRFIKLQVTVTQSPNNPRDERLTPPNGNVYLGLAVVIDSSLPQENQLLLGVIKRTSIGDYRVGIYPWKTRLIDIEKLIGADNYDNLVEVPGLSNTIYGVIKDSSSNNLIDINEWTWLSYSSVLARYLRNMAAVPDDNGKPGGISGDSNLTMLRTIVGFLGGEATGSNQPAQSYNAGNNKILRPYFTSDGIETLDKSQPGIMYKVLKSGQKAPDCYEYEYIPLPYASYNNASQITRPIESELTNRHSGIVTPETLWKIDTLWADRDSMSQGRQFGPFLTKEAADIWWAEHSSIQPQINDYYWVLSDTISQSGSDLTSSLPVDFGTLSATYQARTSGPVTVALQSSKIIGHMDSDASASVTGTFKGRTTNTGGNVDDFDVDGNITEATFNFTTEQDVAMDEIKGNVTGTGTGTTTFTMTDFTQNVSARYVYLYNPEYPNDITHARWMQQAVLRGFAVPATPTTFGFVRPGAGDLIEDVINDAQTHRLRLNDKAKERILNGGWLYTTGGDAQVISVLSSDTSVFNEIYGTIYSELTIRLLGGGWDAASFKLQRLKGDITLDITNVDMSTSKTEIIECIDIDQLTIVDNSADKTGRVNVTNCTVTPDYFLGIGKWHKSRFTSGSNTIAVNNPWVTVENAFSNTYENSLQTRFVTVTRGEDDVITAEMDIWIKRADWSEPLSEDEFQMLSIKDLNFPPLYFALDANNNPINVQKIPSTLTAKVSGTGGVHRVWDAAASKYVLSGNWISTIDWRNGDILSVNGRMISPAKDRLHGLYDVRFRASVQFTYTDEMVEQSVDYDTIFG